MSLNLRSPTSYDGQLATHTKTGVVRFATDVEASEQTAKNLAVTPSQISASLTAKMASPGPIGGTTPDTATFTTLTHAKENYSTLSSGASAGASYAGTVALVAGTRVVSTTAVTANSEIRLTCQALGTVVVPSALCVSAKSAGTSFTILASQNTDTSTIFWEIVN